MRGCFRRSYCAFCSVTKHNEGRLVRWLNPESVSYHEAQQTGKMQDAQVQNLEWFFFFPFPFLGDPFNALLGTLQQYVTPDTRGKVAYRLN